MDDFKKTALHDAAESGDPEYMKMLIEAGADLEAADENGWTPLMKLVCSGLMNKEVIPVIIAAGADVNAKNNEGMTALHYAAVSNHNNELDCYGSIASEYMLALIRVGADMDIKDDLGRTAEDLYRLTFPSAYKKISNIFEGWLM